MSDQAFDKGKDDQVLYHVISKSTGRVVGKATTKQGARRSVDKNDNKYGSYNHFIKNVLTGGREL